ncbi:MAG: protoporphyrinogen oxidase [Kiritimatiellae bacterium]|nr:protoporphyrinogen oxidase [Kiritimatiellia bacterium]
MTHITIIGGGITGLATAFYLQKKSQETGCPIDYTLLESTPRLGGKIITHTIDDFVIEGGPDSFITQKPWGLQLCHDLGIENQLIPCNQANQQVYVLQQGKLISLPNGFRLTIPTQWMPFLKTNLISSIGKMRVWMERFIPRTKFDQDESLAHFIRRRFGKETLDKIAGPMMAGIYSADPETLSMKSTFPKFLELEKQYGSLLRGIKHYKQPPHPLFMSLKGGMENLIHSLKEKLHGSIKTACQVTGIIQKDHVYEILTESESFRTQAVVMAIPAYASAHLLADLHPTAFENLQKISYTSTATITFGYLDETKTSHTLKGFGFIVPRTDPSPLLACTWTSSKFNHRAPLNRLLFRVFVGDKNRQKLTHMSDEELYNITHTEILAILGLSNKPILHHIDRWENAHPQYTVGHLSRMNELQKSLTSFPGLYLAGSGYKGIGIPDCIHEGIHCANQIFEDRIAR